MNIIKATIATAAVITCCLGNEFPAKPAVDAVAPGPITFTFKG